jgi:hypothetical protein
VSNITGTVSPDLDHAHVQIVYGKELAWTKIKKSSSAL